MMLNHNIVIRFAGDSGDGIQAMGERFTLETALKKNGFTTFPDYPAEIRAPQGTKFGVSAFQIHISDKKVYTPGDVLDVLVAFNPAALQVNIHDLKVGGLLILDKDSFNEASLLKAGYTHNPLLDNSLAPFQVFSPAIDSLVQEIVKDIPNLSRKHAKLSKNMWVLGLLLFLYGRDYTATKDWIHKRFMNQKSLQEANIRTLKAGHVFAEVAELETYYVPSAGKDYSSGLYRALKGSDAIALGLMVGSYLFDMPLLFCSYPITPASSLLHILSTMERYAITTLQTEDEIAAICAAIGASYAGSLGITATSGPGLSLNSEALGLAIATELPLVVIVAQRGGPSTGLPTKTEQSDLWQAMFGRHGDTYLPVIASKTPGDCFMMIIEAMHIAIRFMTPVIFLTDGYLQNTSEPWRIPDLNKLKASYPLSAHCSSKDKEILPYARDSETLARPWIIPGEKHTMHRIGGLERENFTGRVSYDAVNHDKMTRLRQKKILNIANFLPTQQVDGPNTGKLAVISWGSTFGAVACAVNRFSEVAHVHIQYLFPFPRNLATLLSGFEKILIVEMNTGQLHLLLQAFLKRQCNLCFQVTGKPLRVSFIEQEIRKLL